MNIPLLIVALTALVCLGAVIVNNLREYNRIRRERISFYETYKLTGLPLVSFDNNGRTWNFLLDTGSMDSLIDAGALEGMSYTMIDSRARLFGIEGKDKHVSFCSVKLEYKNQKFETELAVSDMKEAFRILKDEYNIQLHGIIGGKFFRKYKYIINFDELIAYSNKG